jgi:Phage integrase family
MNESTLSVEAALSQEDWRVPLPPAFSVSGIHTMTKDQLLGLQQLAGWGSEWGIIDTPKDRLPYGGSRNSDRRILSVNALCSVGPELELVQLTFARFALLLYFGKANLYSGYLKAGTICVALRIMKSALAVALTKPQNPQGGLLARLSEADWHIQRGNTVRDTFGELFSRLRKFQAKGWWLDVPFQRTVGSQESHLDAAKIPVKASKPHGDGHQPLPDDFVAEAGWRLIWILENLGPALIDCGRKLAAIRYSLAQQALAKGLQSSSISDVLSPPSQSFLATYDWRRSDGQKIESLPFAVDLAMSSGSKGGRTEFSWPPRNFHFVGQLLQMLQDAHMFLFLLASGGRISECLSLQPDCVVCENPNQESIAGRTYKLVSQEVGEPRDWPVPSIVLKAIQQQIALSEVIVSLGEEVVLRDTNVQPTSIWVTGTGIDVKGGTSLRFGRTFRFLGLSHLLKGDSANPHRFRKTLARLCALVLFGAPKILMDLFGHKDIAMTLHYINTDPLLRAEMIQIARDITIMYAKDAIANIDGYGGPAARKLSNAIQQEKVRLGRDLGADDMQRCAEMLTDNGSLWTLVRPGVLCTKRPSDAGPCTKARGMPDPAHCQTSCDNRLEQALLRDDVDRSIEQAVGHLEQAYADGDEYASENWIGQVLALLPRFPDIKKKWILHPIVSPLVEKDAEAV